MTSHPRAAVAIISVHADPLAALGGGQNGGMNLAIRRLCEGLAARGLPSDVFTRLSHPGQPREELIAPGSRVVRIPVGPPEPLIPEQVVPYAEAIATAIARHAADEGRAYRAIHGHHWVSGLVAEGLHKRWDVGWAQSFHTLARTKEAVGLNVEPGRAEVEARLCRDADRLVAMSHAEATELRERYAADASHICVIEPGADAVGANNGEELRSRLGLDNHRVILYAGRLEPLKGADTLLDAIACLASGSSYDDVVALIVGDDASVGERKRLEQISADNGITDRVRFIGSVAHEELGDYYALADVCVVPSRAETFGFVALEAQAAGTPVVAADVGGLREIVEDGESGYLVAAGDVAGFCAKIATVLDDAELRERLGAAGRARAGLFTWERAAARLDSIYARMEAGNTHAPCSDPA